ncbi:MAG: arylsulfatase [Opitutales bacterium]
MPRSHLKVISSLLLSLCLFLVQAQNAQAERPNILLIMLDDLGFADLGCYGSEIETPRIDELAEQGLRFSQFYNTSKCHATRVSLLTGLYTNQAGDSKLHRGTTIAQVLGESGYFTSMAGKWHLSKEPTDFGFERYWGHLSGATDFFKGDKTFRLNGEFWNDFDDDFYLTDANVEWSEKFIGEALDSGKPFFHYLAFNAPHYPLQAPKESIKKYLNKYDIGWETIREQRFLKQKRLGLFDDSQDLPRIPNHMKAWDELSAEAQEFESFRMAIYAAMVDHADAAIGRLLDYLKEQRAYENTLVMILSDNGACPFDRSKNLHIEPWKAHSYYVYDSSWATVGNTPLLHYKQTQHEGGISTPFIAHWPQGLTATGTWERSQAHVIDVMATCLKISGAQYPNSSDIEPLQGKSLIPLFRGKTREPHEELYFRFGLCRALRQGDWKIVSFYGHKWELYNIAEDRFEQYNLSDVHPERVKAMAARWHTLAEHKDRLPIKQRKPAGSERPEDHWDAWKNLHTKKYPENWKLPTFE